jgi:hypothetical protein
VGIGSVATDPLAFIREIDQQLAERHHQGLRYPPRLLARAASFAPWALPLPRRPEPPGSARSNLRWMRLPRPNWSRHSLLYAQVVARRRRCSAGL